MKKIAFIILSLILFSCNESCNEYKDLNYEHSRIKFKESKHSGSFNVRIIEVDGVEYLCLYRGGIIELK